MMFSLLPLLAIGSAVVTAQTTHTIVVGVNETEVNVNGVMEMLPLTYTPANITAAVGDTVTFMFPAGAHSATSSNFSTPCTPNGAFDSGIQLIPVNASSNASFVAPTFSIVINDTTPIWGYCAQVVPVPHCEAGMVFAINANANHTYAQFQQAAMALAANSTSTNGTTTTSTSASASGGATSSAPATSAASSAPAAASSSASAGEKTVAVSGLASLFGLLAFLL